METETICHPGKMPDLQGNAMTAYYWIKLYHEVLEDPKMALLPDRLWRRVIELFLLAGKHGKDGTLPDTRQIAWELRQNTDDIELDLRQIESTGIIQRTSSGWMVVKFSARQAPSTATERSQEYRKRQENANATQTQRNVAQINRLTEERNATETETERNVASPFSSLSIPQIISEATGLSAFPPKQNERIEQIHCLLDAHGKDKVVSAFKEQFQKWTHTKGKDGRYYNGLNFGWIDWAQAELDAQVVEKPFSEMTGQEMLEWVRTHPETP